MKLNNSALQELWEELVNRPLTISPYVDSPIYKAFRECDEKLSESITFEEIKRLQSDNDILKRANDALLSANMEAISKNRKLEKDLDDAVKENEKLRREVSTKDKRNNELQKQLLNVIPDHTDESAKKEIDFLRKSRLEWAKRSVDRRKERDDAREECEKLKASLSYSALQKMQKDLDDVKNQLNYCTHSRDNWRSRAKHAEDELRGANKQIQKLKEFNSEITSKNVDIASRNVELARKNELLEAKVLETTETLEKVNADRNELKKDYDKLFEENRKLNARTDCHRNEVTWYRKHYKEQSDKIKELKKQLEELTSQYQKLTIENKRLQNNVRSGYDQGQTDLWVALQNVNNSQPFELATCFPDVTGMEDILNWDLEDFLDAYRKWWEEKEKERLDHMRDYLARFCEGRVCEGCPLESNEYKCGCGYSFKKTADWDMKIIPDEELERYYKRAWHGDATAEKVKAACDAFAEGLKAGLASEVKEVPVYCDIPIKDLASWECTIEATVEINKDLLEKVCGVKSDDKK